ncbi:MAG TPA: hypothetical protein VLL27_04305 [Solirubrobacterales bacterium]|nr:hypothetical protein [Solirubrobacterales bacterium]
MRLGYAEQGFVFLNGENSLRPWEELRTAYIHGCFQAAVLIGQCFLENLLGGVAHFSDKADGRPGLGDLLTVAREEEWLLESEFNEFNVLAKLRNPYAHYRSFHHADSLRARAERTGQDPHLILQSDCERFLLRLHEFVHRRFGIGCVVVPPEFDVLPAVNPDQLEISTS